MSKALAGSHYCIRHQGNHSHYAEDNCIVCRAVKDLMAQQERIAELEQENESLRDPNWLEYVALTERWLEKYPPDIFTGVSGDSGPLFVVAVRNALKALKEQG